MELVDTICQASMRAAAEMIAVKRLSPDLDAVTAALRAQILAQYAEVTGDLKDALDAHMGEPMYREILNVACNKIALDALKQVGAL